MRGEGKCGIITLKKLLSSSGRGGIIHNKGCIKVMSAIVRVGRIPKLLDGILDENRRFI